MENKFKAGDIPTQGLELDWTIRDAAVGDMSDDSYWPTLPPCAPGQGLEAMGLYAVLSAIRSTLGAPTNNGKFSGSVSAETIADIIGCGESTVRKYLPALREIGAIRWVRHTRNYYELNTHKLARAAKHYTARRRKAALGREKQKAEEQARLDKLWEVPDEEEVEAVLEDSAAPAPARDLEQEAKDAAVVADLGAEPPSNDEAETEDVVIDITAEDFDSDDYADGTTNSFCAYGLAIDIYENAGRTTITKTALDKAAVLLLPLMTVGGDDISVDDLLYLKKSMRWAILQSDYWGPLIKDSAKRYDFCPVRWLMANWEDTATKHKIKHHSEDHAKEFLPLEADDEEDILAAAAREDALAEAQQAAEAKTAVKPAAVVDEVEGDAYDWRKDTEKVEVMETYIRLVYDKLGRTDIPADLTPTLERIVPLITQIGPETWGHLMRFALNHEKFWLPGMQKPAKKHGGCPFTYFIHNLDTIRAQVDEKAAKAVAA